MKTAKIILGLSIFFSILFFSCTDNESIKNEAVVEKSSALRIVLNNLKKENNIAGRSVTLDEVSCFDFVYPLTLSYNNNTEISVASIEGLLSVLENENDQLYITGIAFPCQVLLNGQTTPITIDNENELWDLVNQCEFETYDDYVFSSSCYELVYPISFVGENGQSIQVNSQEALFQLFSNPDQVNVIYDFVYPFSVVSGTSTVVINSEYDLYQLNDDCSSSSDCICPTVYQPVCVQTSNGDIEIYPNACTAECDGYTAADIVNCNGGNSIFDDLGSCFTMVYPVQVQTGGITVTVTNDSQLLGLMNQTTNTASLVFPVTVNAGPGGVAQFTFLDQSIMDATLSNICN